MRYSPFDVELRDVTETHLAGLCDVAEGWYVEYKSQTPKPRDLAKSLSSFANRHGGWLFLGIEEDAKDNTAATFPGIADSDVPTALEQLRNAAKDLLQPTVLFSTQTLTGPLPALSLAAGRSIIVVRIPEGGSPPYIHNEGRIYIRTGDSSSPVPATDRTTFDLLHNKGQDRAASLERLFSRRPLVSKGEEDVSYLHLFLASDPLDVLGHWYGGSFSEFSTTMSQGPIPFDNIYTSQDGFVARQTRGNKRYDRRFTWEFARKCNSFVTLPLSDLRAPFGDPSSAGYELGEWSQFLQGEQFASILSRKELHASRVLNLNMLITLIGGIIARHRSLAGAAGVRGPFYIKAALENVWRVIPFWDTSEYISHIKAFDVPIVQDSDLAAPLGGWPEGFIIAPELDDIPNEGEHAISQPAIATWIAVMQALGVPGEVLGKEGNNALDVANREAELHRNRMGD